MEPQRRLFPRWPLRLCASCSLCQEPLSYFSFLVISTYSTGLSSDTAPGSLPQPLKFGKAPWFCAFVAFYVITNHFMLKLPVYLAQSLTLGRRWKMALVFIASHAFLPSPSHCPIHTHSVLKWLQTGSDFKWNCRLVEGWTGTEPVSRGDWGLWEEGEALTWFLSRTFGNTLAFFQAQIVDSPRRDLARAWAGLARPLVV